MAVFEHRLGGCSPQPLGSYLKALGVFRIVAEQADRGAAGFWQDERFMLRTSLDEAALLAFFCEVYAPSPIVSPWNAGSGFYFRERKGEKDQATGKKHKTGIRDEETEATRTLSVLEASSATRFAALRAAAAEAKASLNRASRDTAPADERKQRLIAALRSTLPDQAVSWIDAAVAVLPGNVAYPPLLGSGGNDGNLDFSTNFHQALGALFDVPKGEPLESSGTLLAASLLGTISPGVKWSAISQFSAAAGGGKNGGAGFDADPNGNPWDMVLAVEGSLLLASAASRRLGSTVASGGAFPFMTPFRGVLSAGAGHVGLADEQSARGEFWAPLWTRPTGLGELAGLFHEGRLVVERRNARTSLDFARAIAQIGSSRGIDAFDRHAFQKRNGNMFLSVVLTRHKVPQRPVHDMVADLDRGNWLGRMRSAMSGGGGELAGLRRRLDETLFRLAQNTAPEVVQAALIAIGAALFACAKRTEMRTVPKGKRDPLVAPPPLLAKAWRELADDGSAEFRLAAALAGIASRTVDDADGTSIALPLRVHLAPVLAGQAGRRDVWSETTAARAVLVWQGRELVSDLGAVLERRLVEAQRHVFVDFNSAALEHRLPLAGTPTAPMSDVMAFLAGATDDQRIAELAMGLAWVQRGALRAAKPPDRCDALPFAYAALKPLFDPTGIEADGERRMVDPLPLLRLVRAGRVKAEIFWSMISSRSVKLSPTV
jgi:CRISPR-associated protein Csx17